MAPFSLDRGRKQGSVEFLGARHAFRHFRLRHRAVIDVLFPGAAGQITPHHAFHRHWFGFPAQGGAAVKQFLPAFQLRNQPGYFTGVRADYVVFHDSVRLFEPERRQLVQHLALARNSARHYHVESAHPVGGQQQQPLSQVITIAHLPAAEFADTEVCFSDDLHKLIPNEFIVRISGPGSSRNYR